MKITLTQSLIELFVRAGLPEGKVGLIKSFKSNKYNPSIISVKTYVLHPIDTSELARKHNGSPLTEFFDLDLDRELV